MSKKLMIFFPLLLLLFIFCIFSTDILATETKSEDLAIREYVFLIDTSASMSWGKDYPGCDHDPLAPKLKETIIKFIDTIQEDLSEAGVEIQFYFYPFDEGIAKQADNKIFNTSSSKENYKRDIENYINNLIFKGHSTYICSSLETVLENHKATDHPVIIRLYTDGEENEKDSMTGEVKWPPWDKFWEKIESLLEGTKWTENKKLSIITLEIKWPHLPDEYDGGGGGEPPKIYAILVKPTEINFGNLYDAGEEKRELTFSILSKEIDWNKFIENYPDLRINITHQEFRPEIEKFIRDFPSIRLSSLGDGKYNLTFKIDKDEMIKNENFGEFKGSLSLSINLKEVKENIDVSIDNYIPISFNFYRPEVEVLPVSLNFGSLETGDVIIKKISFNYNEKAIEDKSKFTISIESSENNPSSLSIGKNILLNNQTTKEVSISAPTSYIDFQISLAQNELDPGDYKGKLVFTSDELFITVEDLLSDRKNSKIKYIPWTFTIYPSPEVKIILLKPGEGKIPINFGLIKEEKQYQQEIMLEFNQQAKGKELKVSLSISPDNPSELEIGENLWINGQKKKSIDIISATKEIELVLEVTPSELKYGKYYGRINFTSENLNIEGDNLELNSTNPNQKYYEWTFKTPMPPWMIILIVAICLIVLLIIIYLIWTIKKGGSISLPSIKSSKAVIPDETYLYIRNYDTGKQEQVDISGKTDVIIGKEGQYLSDIEEKITLRAVKEAGKTLVRLTVESGKVSLLKAGSKEEELVTEQLIFNRDVIKLSTYKIRVSGFYLEKY